MLVDDGDDAGLCYCVQCAWYWGALSWDEASMWLSDLPDGSFLVRDSSDDRYILSLSFRSHGRTHHTRIEHYKGQPPVALASHCRCSVAPPGGRGEASPLWVDVQKLCNMRVLSLSWNFFVSHDKYIARLSSKEPR